MGPSKRDSENKPNITRRDFLNGVAMASAASLIPNLCLASRSTIVPLRASTNSSIYPPALSGMRGNHDGSFEVLHQLAMAGKSQWGSLNNLDQHYDLIIVGAGLSGLSAAHFYRQKHPQATILILDNHDDFGGHAKRNEFKLGEQTLVGYGGSQTMQEPNFYPSVVKQLLSDIGVDLNRLAAGYDTEFFKRHGLRAGTQFQKSQWGVNKFVAEDMGYFNGYMPMVRDTVTFDQAIETFPISPAAKKQLKYLFTVTEDKLSRFTEDAKWEYLWLTSYKDFLVNDLGITEQQVFDVLEYGSSDVGIGLDANPAIFAMDYGTLPGWGATGLSSEYKEVGYREPYVHHFPDGNATIARLIVRKLIPSVAPGETQEDIVTAEFDYSQLDKSGSSTRIRLSSPVVNVSHDGLVETAQKVKVTYVNQGNSYQVTGGHIIMACNNRVIPKLCPELPAAQKQGLSKLLKTPILYTTVLLRNWRAWKALGIGGVISPLSYYVSATLDFPMSIGDYQFSTDPDQPVIVHLERFAYNASAELSDHEQFKAGRIELMSTPFAVIEEKTRQQLQDLLGDGGFDASKDILGITVNRWSHGYSAWYNPLFSPSYDNPNDKRYPHIAGRQPFGRIRIANSDSGNRALMESAVEQAYRAVQELT